jgi:hypothetical protein
MIRHKTQRPEARPLVGAPPVREDFAWPGVTSTFLWISAFLDCSGISLTAVDESQPANGATIKLNPRPSAIKHLAVVRFLRHIFCFSGSGVSSPMRAIGNDLGFGHVGMCLRRQAIEAQCERAPQRRDLSTSPARRCYKPPGTERMLIARPVSRVDYRMERALLTAGGLRPRVSSQCQLLRKIRGLIRSRPSLEGENRMDAGRSSDSRAGVSGLLIGPPGDSDGPTMATRGVTPVNARSPRRGRSGFAPDSLFAGLGRLPGRPPASSDVDESYRAGNDHVKKPDQPPGAVAQ